MAISCIIMALITMKKIIKPMTRMLKSANHFENKYDSEGNVELSDLQDKLIAANRQKLNADTILKHMTDGVISFDMQGECNIY